MAILVTLDSSSSVFPIVKTLGSTSLQVIDSLTSHAIRFGLLAVDS